MRKGIFSSLFRSAFLHLFLFLALIIGVFKFTKKKVSSTPVTIEGVSLPKALSKSPEKSPDQLTDKSLEKSVEQAVSLSQTVHEHEIERATEGHSEAPASAGSSGGMIRSEISPDEMQKYLLQVTERINRSKQYPKESRAHGEVGEVLLTLQISPEGKILHTQIEKTSGFKSLDDAALAAMDAMEPLPSLPLAQDGKPFPEPILLHIPLQFKLR